MSYTKKQLLATTSLVAALSAIAAVSPAQASSTLVATIYGIYDAEDGIGDLPSAVITNPNNPNQYGNSGEYDTPSLFFINPTGYSITGAQMVLSVSPAQNNGYDTYNNGDSQTVGLGTLNPNSITQVSWGYGGQLFAYDYDDEYSSNYGYNPFTGGSNGYNGGTPLADCTLTDGPGAPDPQWFNFCAPTGNFQVRFSGTLSGSGPLNGQGVAAVFSEVDVAHQYIGWEGLDPNGWSENLSYDVHSGTVSGVLANIYLGTTSTVPTSPNHAAPEPTTLALIGGGLGLLAATRRRKKAAKA